MIKIDATPFLNGIQVLRSDHLEAVTNVLVGVAEMARAQISSIAQQKLSKRTSEEYVKGLQEPLEIQPGSVTLTLVGQFPNMLESGFPSFDMKPGLLAGPTATTGGASRYVDVPFEYSKKSGGEGGLQSLSPAAAKSLGQAVKKAKDKLGSGSGSFSARGKKFAPEKLGWKTSQYSDVKQNVTVKAGRISSQSNPKTFRRISEDGSDPDSWIHPGLGPDKAVQAFPEVQPFILDELDKAMKKVLEKIQ